MLHAARQLPSWLTYNVGRSQVNFYVLNDPTGKSPYASFAHLGTWSADSECEGCGSHSQHLIEPLLVEWEDGSDRIGSFSWCSYTCIVTDEVRRFLETTDTGCRFGRVQVVPPERKTKHPRVSFPYSGPRLHWLSSVPLVDVDIDASRLELRLDCPQCGRKAYHFKREGLVINRGQLGTARMFCIRQFAPSNATFVVEDFLVTLGMKRFVNLEGSLAGIIS
jgi:hypothetical protein